MAHYWGRTDDLINLNKTLDGHNILNSPSKLSTEAKWQLTLIEKKIQESQVEPVDQNLSFIFVILPSKHFSTGTVMQREDIILEQIFSPHKLRKNQIVMWKKSRS